ncbi:MAG: 3-phosphoshikimate 1-carboxyvinyltransferase, partial [Propionibacteriaceae bacterium]|nr:3-phosphoshikimate 1-carboxyvinyltransferase [Propionibacteriaceae bacterium]
TITGGLVARDTDLMVAALRALGATIDVSGDVWTVTPGPVAPAGSVDGGLAGTVLRFVPPVAALAAGPTTFHGDPAAAARPVAPLLDGLAQLGAQVAGTALPFTVAGPVTGRTATIDASGSSQFVSGLLLAAARYPEGIELRHEGPPVPSYPHIEMTIAALRARGVAVFSYLRRTPRLATAGAEALVPTWWRVAPGPITAAAEAIEPDLTTAAVFLAAALVKGGAVTVPAWPATSTQPGLRTPDILTQFGGAWRRDEADGSVTVSGDGRLMGADLDLHSTSELTPVVAALAALAGTPTTIRGVAHIRGHETDRLAALAGNISALGGRVTETADGLRCLPGPLHGGVWPTHGDHRLAHAGALIGLRVPGVVLDDVTVVAKTMPEFARVWKGLR